jgi:hypothetical protein
VHDDPAGFFFGLTERAVMAEDLAETIAQNAQGPESAEADGVKVKQHPLPDQTRLRPGYAGQVAADKYLAGKEAARRNPARAFTSVKIVSPGSA